MQRHGVNKKNNSATAREGPGLARLCTVLAALCLQSPAVAELEPELAYFRLYGVEQGLSQNSIATIRQDSDGFLWIGTRDGLNRFDGYDFVVFRRSIDDPASLASSDIAVLFEDRAGRLWVGTNGGGLNILDRTTERITRIVIDGTLPATVHVTSMCSQGDDHVWVGTEIGLVRVTGFDGGEIRTAPIGAEPGELADAEISGLGCAGTSTLWAATRRRGLFRVHDGRVESFPLPAIDGVDASRLATVESGAEGETWVGANGGALYRIGVDGSVRGWGVAGPADDNVRIRALLADGSGNIWLAGLGVGLQRFTPASGRFTDFGGPSNREDGLSDKDTYSLHLDRSGVLWVGTLSGGLNNLGLFSGGFERYRAQPGSSNGLSHNMVTAFAEYEGRIWIGTDGGGLNRFDPVSKTFDVLRHDPGRPASLADDRVWALTVDRDDTLWVGSWGGGLSRRLAGTEEFERLRTVPGNITALAAGVDGTIWIGTPDWGLHRWLPGSGSSAPFTATLEDGRPLATTSVPDLHVTEDGSLWIATWDNGLIRLRPNGALTRWQHLPGDDAALASDTIRSITEAPDGRFWLGTAAGLTHFDPDTGSVLANHDVAEGLPPSVIYAALPDELGRVWVSSNRGIARFDVTTETARSYDPRDGLQGFEFNGAAALRSSDGYIYFGGTNGFNRFQPGSLRDNPFPPAVVLTDFLLFNEVQRPGQPAGESILDRSLQATSAITLEHTQDVIALQFAALHFVSPERNQYAYRLDGFDRDWISTDATRRIAAYTNLDAGEYRFRVKAANSDGIWSDAEATLDLEVLAPWWATRPAMLTYFITAILLVSLFVRWRTVYLRRRAVELQKMVRDRTRLVSEQKDTIAAQADRVEQILQSKEQLFARVSHEFRTPLTLILGSLERLRGSTREPATRPISTIETSGRRLLRLVDQLLGLASLDKQQPGEAAPQALHAITRLAVDSFDSLAESKDVSLAARRIETAWVLAPPESLDQVVLNLLSNAIKFTPDGGRIDVSLEAVGDAVRLSVTDTGTGIEAELQKRIFEPFEHGHVAGSGTGIGLALVREIVASLNGGITLESQPGEGSRFDVTLPVCAAPPDAETTSGASATNAADAARDTERALSTEVLPDTESAADPAEEARPEVLVVEDSDELRRFLVETLSPKFRVAAAPNGVAALAVAQEELPDLIVSDVMMPQMDGFEFCKAIKSDERTSHIPVVLLTARGDRDSLLQGLEEGADEYLTKPFDPAALVLRVRNLLETRQMLRARLASAVDRSVGRDGQAAAGREAEPGLNQRDRAFLERLGEFLDKRHADAELTVTEIAAAVAMSERQLQRKLKALLNRSPMEHLRIYRLHRAADLIREGHPVGNVAIDTGFSSASHFGACFKALFDATPGEYAKSRSD